MELFFNRQTAVAAVVGAGRRRGPRRRRPVGRHRRASATSRCTPGLRQLSRLIFDRYVFPFELVSLVLVAAMIGAIVLATREKERP